MNPRRESPAFARAPEGLAGIAGGFGAAAGAFGAPAGAVAVGLAAAAGAAAVVAVGAGSDDEPAGFSGSAIRGPVTDFDAAHPRTDRRSKTPARGRQRA